MKFATLDVNYEELTNVGFGNLNHCIALPKRTCAKCQLPIENFKFGSILFLDVQPLNVPGLKINVEDIPRDISSIESRYVINDQTYILNAIIEHIPSKSHYIIKCLRHGTWYVFDDLKTSPERSTTHLVRPHLLILNKE